MRAYVPSSSELSNSDELSHSSAVGAVLVSYIPGAPGAVVLDTKSATKDATPGVGGGDGSPSVVSLGPGGSRWCVSAYLCVCVCVPCVCDVCPARLVTFVTRKKHARKIEVVAKIGHTAVHFTLVDCTSVPGACWILQFMTQHAEGMFSWLLPRLLPSGGQLWVPTALSRRLRVSEIAFLPTVRKCAGLRDTKLAPAR